MNIIENDFYKNTSLIKYSKNDFSIVEIKDINNIKLGDKTDDISWLNTYGNKYQSIFKEIIRNNNLDDFLVRLTQDEHKNKVIDLNNLLFIAIEVLVPKEQSFDIEQMYLIANGSFIWSIQENYGKYFEWIRERLKNNQGLIREKKADYLLFLILDSMISNYENTFQEISDFNDKLFNLDSIKPTPHFTKTVEDRKQEILKLKKATKSLRDTITKLEKTEIHNFNHKYFNESREQINNLIADIDFELQEVDSNINLIFSIQGYRLNEVMKTLTIFSVIFIPLTFLAGIYGMNFDNMPELKMRYAYFVLLGSMLIITFIAIIYFKKKKWF